MSMPDLHRRSLSDNCNSCWSYPGLCTVLVPPHRKCCNALEADAICEVVISHLHARTAQVNSAHFAHFACAFDGNSKV